MTTLNNKENDLVKLAVKKIEEFRNNKIIMDFVRNEALEKVASELNMKGCSTTAKGVALLICHPKNFNIEKRVKQYIETGLYGALIAAAKV